MLFNKIFFFSLLFFSFGPASAGIKDKDCYPLFKQAGVELPVTNKKRRYSKAQKEKISGTLIQAINDKNKQLIIELVEKHSFFNKSS